MPITLTPLYRKTFAEIDLEALAKNVSWFQELPKDSSEKFEVIPMVKANAYGHGDIEVMKCLQNMEGIKYLGVSLVEEGVALRLAGWEGEILQFGSIDESAIEAIKKSRITPVINNFTGLNILKKHGQELKKSGIPGFHLKFNTGMNRFGFRLEEVETLKRTLQRDFSEGLVCGLSTHLLMGEDAGQSQGFTSQQVSQFIDIVEGFGKEKLLSSQSLIHCFNSPALMNSSKELNVKIEELSKWGRIAIRPGIGIYGLRDGLNPVMSLKSRIVALQNVQKDEVVSYGAGWAAKKDSVVGLVPVGYGDGYPRVLSNKAMMLFRGERVPIAGTICMDYTMIDLTDVSGLSSISNIESLIGEEVVLIGEQGEELISADELASLAGTISYEIVTGIGRRVPRLFCNSK